MLKDFNNLCGSCITVFLYATAATIGYNTGKVVWGKIQSKINKQFAKFTRAIMKEREELKIMKNIVKGIIVVAVAIPVSIIGMNTVGRVIEMQKAKRNQQ